MPSFKRSIPHLPVRNLKETLTYYCEKLGFSEEWTFGDRDGGIQRNDLTMLFAEDPDHVVQINDDDHRLPLVWFVEDVADIEEEFKRKDIQIVAELKLHPYGLREFAFVDINGYYIRVAEQFNQ